MQHNKEKYMDFKLSWEMQHKREKYMDFIYMEASHAHAIKYQVIMKMIKVTKKLI